MSLLPRDPEVYRRPAVRVLLAANAIPLICVLFFGWDMFTLIGIYWLETAVIGFYMLVKLGILAKWGSLFFIPFYAVYLGAFMGMHWFLVCKIFGPPDCRGGSIACLEDLLTQREVQGMLLLFLASHGYSFLVHSRHRVPGIRSFLIGDRRTDRLVWSTVRETAGRVLLMQVAVFLGGFLSVFFVSNRLSYAVLVLLKTGADLRGHLWFHDRQQVEVTRLKVDGCKL